MPALFRMPKTIPASYQIRRRGKYYQTQSACANFMRRAPQHIQHLIIHSHSLGRKRRAGHIPIIQNRLPGQRLIPHRAQQVPPVNQTHMKRSALTALRRVLPEVLADGADVLWQVGVTEAADLGSAARAA